MIQIEREKLEKVLESLENNKKNHHYCEDTWYSCPKHEDGCANESEGDECNCGADEINAQFDTAMDAIKEALAQHDSVQAKPEPEQEPVDCKRCNRLEDALKRANGLAEHFERAWYLRGDEIERLTAQPEQEPVATVESVATVVSESGNQEVTMSWWHEPALPVGTKLYTTPPQRTWVGLTDEDISKISQRLGIDHDDSWTDLKQAIEAKLKEKNT